MGSQEASACRSLRAIRSVALVVGAVLVLGACGWSQRGYDASRSNWNPHERQITTATVGSLEVRFNTQSGRPGRPESVVADSRHVFIVANDASRTVQAFPLDGQGCIGAPGCQPVWTLPVSGELALDHGYLYVAHASTSGGVAVSAYRAGAIPCAAGDPRCAPAFTANADGFAGHLALANGLLYVGGPGGTAIFDAFGRRGCSGAPRSCAPVATLPGIDLGRSVIEGSRLYTAGAGGIEVHDARGRGCNAAVCAPQRTFGVPGAVPAAVVGSWVYTHGGGEVAAYDARTACPGCPPAWSATYTPGFRDGFAATPKAVFVVDQPGAPERTTLRALDARTGSLLWSAPLGIFGLQAGPVVAGDLVYATAADYFPDDGDFAPVTAAFDLRGRQGCSEGVCTPLWTTKGSNGTTRTQLIVASGHVVMAYADWGLTSFGLSAGS